MRSATSSAARCSRTRPPMRPGRRPRSSPAERCGLRSARDPVRRLHRPGGRVDGPDRDRRARRRGQIRDGPSFPWAASGRALALGRDEGLTPSSCSGRAGPEETRARLRDRRRRRRRADRRGGARRWRWAPTAEDLALTIHPHPTLSETVAFAAELQEGTITDLVRPGGRRPAAAARRSGPKATTVSGRAAPEGSPRGPALRLTWTSVQQNEHRERPAAAASAARRRCRRPAARPGEVTAGEAPGGSAGGAKASAASTSSGLGDHRRITGELDRTCMRSGSGAGTANASAASTSVRVLCRGRGLPSSVHGPSSRWSGASPANGPVQPPGHTGPDNLSLSAEIHSRSSTAPWYTLLILS